MNGYQLIMNLSNEERARMLGISDKEAETVKIMTRDELSRYEPICPETMKGIDYKAKCREKLYCCYDCREEFLDEEIRDWSEDSDS